MRKIVFSIIFLLCAALTMAENTSNMFVNMPDSMLPYIPKPQRTELLTLKDLAKNEPAELQTVFEENVILSEVSDDRLVVQPTKGITYELIRLEGETDSVFCFLRTVSLPEQETSVMIYDAAWKKLGDVAIDAQLLVHKPDTMSEETCADVLKLIEFPIVEVHSTENAGVITASLSAPYVNKEEKERLSAILVTRKMKWDSKTLSFTSLP